MASSTVSGRGNEGTPPTAAKGGTGRLAGIDVARGLAVVGMFAVHLNPGQLDVGDPLRLVLTGRATALFALLAGVSVALLSGGAVPRTGAELRVVRVRLAVRAVLLFVLGLGLAALGTTVQQILTVYAVLFALVIPLLRLSPTVLAASAAASAVAGPIASFRWRSGATRVAGQVQPTGFVDLTSWAGVADALEGLLVSGPFPALTWCPFLLAGMALGRCDLRAARIRRRLAVTGVALAVLSYGGSWLLMNPLGGYRRIGAATGVGVAEAWARVHTVSGAVPTAAGDFLLSAAGHSGAPLEIVGVVGAGTVVVVASLWVVDRLPRAVEPLAAIGAMALSCYTGHILLLGLIGMNGMVLILTVGGYLPIVLLVVLAAVLAIVWRRWFGRGPLERLLSAVASVSGRIVVRADRPATGMTGQDGSRPRR